MDVFWIEGQENATVQNRDQALTHGFETAVAMEALHVLPGPVLPPERQQLLREFLIPHAKEYVLSYSEFNFASEGDSRSLGLDVKVNRKALKTTLQKTGVFYTTKNPVYFELRFLEEPAPDAPEKEGIPDTREILWRLQQLSGVQVLEGSEVSLSLKSNPEGLWAGRLAAGDSVWTSQSRDLEQLWFDLWGGYFSRPGAGAGLILKAALTISGWSAVDGVQAFDSVLASWEKEVESAVLTDVSMLPAGISAHWEVKTLDKGAFVGRLMDYLPGRGLSYVLE
ncbi:MAG: hypothetical protein SVS15_06535 [Thermodesulfobacteriota bacterium]|nr:hypothetical protein [Thermodesulfobacteriota bacterium]